MSWTPTFLFMQATQRTPRRFDDYDVLHVSVPWKMRARFWARVAIRPLCILLGHVRFTNGGTGCSRCWMRRPFT